MFLIYRHTALICFTHDGREKRETPQLEGECFSQKQDMWRAPLEQLLEESGVVDASRAARLSLRYPQIHPPVCYPALFYIQSDMSALFSSSFSLLSHSITICLPHLCQVFSYRSISNVHALPIYILYLLSPSIHLPCLPHNQTSSCLHSPSPSYSFSTGVRRRRRRGKPDASTMTGVGSGCLAVSNGFFMTGV